MRERGIIVGTSGSQYEGIDMLVFAHTGITLGAGLLLKNKLTKEESNESSPRNRDSPIRRFFESLDLRLLITGSLLPDIIDKPLGLILLSRVIGYGRIYFHTLIFLLIISIAGMIVYRRRRHGWILTLAIGVLSHLLLDEMWFYPRTLFWPLYGWAFPRENVADYVSILLHELTTEPKVYIPEALGLLIVLFFIVRLIKKRTLLSFIFRGKSEPETQKAKP